MGITIDEVNGMNFEKFTQVFGNVIEHCNLVAISVWGKHPFRDLKHFHHEICHFIDELPALAQEGILRLHPDLAGRLAEHGNLTAESSREQEAAQLNTLSPEEKLYLTNHNESYKRKFQFPFVICARENKKQAMMDGISNRLNNSQAVELRAGIEEVKKIAYYRIAEIITP